MSKKVLVILASGFEEMEGVISIDILRRAGLNVTVAGLKKEVVSARELIVKSEVLLQNVQGNFDALVLPGGARGAQNLAADTLVKEWITKMHANKKWVAAICAAPAVVLAPMGILDGLCCTGYPGTEGGFSSSSKVLKQAVVVDQNVITSNGPGNAILFALTIVEKLCGVDLSQKIKQDLLI